MRLCVGLLLFMVSAAGVAQAQQDACTVRVNAVTGLQPYGLWPPNQTGGGVLPPELLITVRDLPPQAFIARQGHHPIRVVSVETEEGPRRIVFVVAYGKAHARAARRVQGQAGPTGAELSAILSSARPEDSFALLAGGGPRIALPFGSSRDAIRSGIDELSHPNPDGPRGPDVLEALLEATTWFGSPKTGDSIFLFGALSRESRDVVSQLRSALSSRSVRLFCLGGAGCAGGASDPPTGEWCSPLVGVSAGSGGGWEPLGYMGPKAEDYNLWLWRNEAKALYEMATFSYVIHLDRTGPHVKIGFSPEALSRRGWLALSYPTPLPVCPPPAGGAPAAGQKKR